MGILILVLIIMLIVGIIILVTIDDWSDLDMLGWMITIISFIGLFVTLVCIPGSIKNSRVEVQAIEQFRIVLSENRINSTSITSLERAEVIQSIDEYNKKIISWKESYYWYFDKWYLDESTQTVNLLQ